MGAAKMSLRDLDLQPDAKSQEIKAGFHFWPGKARGACSASVSHLQNTDNYIYCLKLFYQLK